MRKRTWIKIILCFLTVFPCEEKNVPKLFRTQEGEAKTFQLEVWI